MADEFGTLVWAGVPDGDCTGPAVGAALEGGAEVDAAGVSGRGVATSVGLGRADGDDGAAVSTTAALSVAGAARGASATAADGSEAGDACAPAGARDSSASDAHADSVKTAIRHR